MYVYIYIIYIYVDPDIGFDHGLKAAAAKASRPW
jgi:hypothetical protein